jgi:hypothetical protein
MSMPDRLPRLFKFVAWPRWRRVLANLPSCPTGMASILLVATLQRLWRLGLECASRDECFSWRMIQYPLWEQVERTAADVHPPLYYLVLSGWSSVAGSSMIALRGLSVLLSLASIPLMYLAVSESLAWRNAVTHPRSRHLLALFAAALLAFHPAQVEAARVARMYSLGVFHGVLSAWLLLRALRAQADGNRWWTAHGLSLAALAYTHYFGFFTIAAQWAFVGGLTVIETLARRRDVAKRYLLGAIVSIVVAALLYAPWVPHQLAQMRQVQAGYWIPRPTWRDVADAFSAWSAGLERPALEELIIWGVVVMVPIVAGLWRRRAMTLFWLCQAAAAWAASLAISWSSDTPIFQPRYLVISHAAWVGLMGVSVAALKRPLLQFIFGWLISTTCLFGAWAQMAAIPGESPAVAQAFEWIARVSRDGDVVITGWWAEVNRVRYYAWAAGAKNLPVKCERPDVDPEHHYVHLASLSDEDFTTDVEMARHQGRWWSVVPHGGSVPVRNPTILDQKTFLGPRDHVGWTVTLYNIPSRRRGADALKVTSPHTDGETFARPESCMGHHERSMVALAFSKFSWSSRSSTSS